MSTVVLKRNETNIDEASSSFNTPKQEPNPNDKLLSKEPSPKKGLESVSGEIHQAKIRSLKYLFIGIIIAVVSFSASFCISLTVGLVLRNENNALQGKYDLLLQSYNELYKRCMPPSPPPLISEFENLTGHDNTSVFSPFLLFWDKTES